MGCDLRVKGENPYKRKALGLAVNTVEILSLSKIRGFGKLVCGVLRAKGKNPYACKALGHGPGCGSGCECGMGQRAYACRGSGPEPERMATLVAYYTRLSKIGCD